MKFITQYYDTINLVFWLVFGYVIGTYIIFNFIIRMLIIGLNPNLPLKTCNLIIPSFIYYFLKSILYTNHFKQFRRKSKRYRSKKGGTWFYIPIVGLWYWNDSNKYRFIVTKESIVEFVMYYAPKEPNSRELYLYCNGLIEWESVKVEVYTQITPVHQECALYTMDEYIENFVDKYYEEKGLIEK